MTLSATVVSAGEPAGWPPGGTGGTYDDRRSTYGHVRPANNTANILPWHLDFVQDRLSLVSDAPVLENEEQVVPGRRGISLRGVPVPE